MTPPVDQEATDFASDLAVRPGEMAAERFFAGNVDHARKADVTDVSDADLAVEEFVRAELGRVVPADEIHG